MCIICVEFQQEKLTLTEARRNFNEMRETMDSEHASEVDEMLLAEEQAANADMMSVDPEPEQLDFFNILDLQYPFYADEYDDSIICSD